MRWTDENVDLLLTAFAVTSDVGSGAPGGMPSTGPSRGGPGITFDRFVRACVVIKTLTESFQRHDTQRSGWVQINYDTFMEMCLSAP